MKSAAQIFLSWLVWRIIDRGNNNLTAQSFYELVFYWFLKGISGEVDATVAALQQEGFEYGAKVI